MLWSKDYINRFFSGTLLILLLLVHSVKLLHSHPDTRFFATKSAKPASFDQLTNNDETKLPADCEICNYQITKDTDGTFSFIEYSSKIEQLSFYNEYILASPRVFHSVSASRGPPAA